MYKISFNKFNLAFFQTFKRYANLEWKKLSDANRKKYKEEYKKQMDHYNIQLKEWSKK